MEPGIKITHDNKKLSTLDDNVIRESFASNIGISFSNFHHSQAMLSFNNQIWKNTWKKIVKKFACSIPSMYRAFIGSFACISISLLLTSSKKVIKPLSQALSGASNSKFAMPLCPVPVSSLFNLSKIETTFSIDYTCKVCELFRSLSSCKWYIFSHKIPTLMIVQ